MCRHEKSKEHIQSSRNEEQRAINGKTLRDKVGTDDIRRHHIKRMDETRKPRMAFEGQPIGRRLPGRQHERWRNSGKLYPKKPKALTWR